MSKGDETLTPLGRSIRVKLATRHLKHLKLDVDNPRVRHDLAVAKTRGKPMGAQEIGERLWGFPETKALYHAIKASGGLTEALYILEDGTVKEGNRRLVCIRKIAERLEEDKASQNGNPSFTEEETAALTRLVTDVPVKVLPKDVTQPELDVLLARWHVAGKDQWSALDQAAHVYRLNYKDGLSVPQIATLLGKSDPWVYQKLRAYEWTEGYLAENASASIQDYSYFEELYKKRAALKKVGFDVDDPQTMDDFKNIVKSKALPMAIDVRRLPSLLENVKTKKLLLSGDGEKAIKVLEDVDPAEYSPRFASLKQARSQLKALTIDEVDMLREKATYRQLLQGLIDDLQNVLARAK